MAIETMAGGGVMVTGSDIETYRRLAMLKMMEINLKTGMTHSRGNPFAVAAEMMGVPLRRSAKGKREVYAAFCAFMGREPKPELL